MRIIGIDPGTAQTGFAILQKEKGKVSLLDYGCIVTEKTLKSEERLNEISKDLVELLKKWKPKHASIEKIFFQKNVKTAIAVAQARGVVLQTLQDNNVGISEYTPPEIKSAVCGYGKADKKMVQEMVKRTLGLNKIPKPDDAADAIAIAICLINRIRNA